MYLTADGCTKHEVNYIVINHQLYKEGKLQIKALLISNRKEKHKGLYNANMTKDIMLKFDIKQRQLLGVADNNASAMMKAVETLNMYKEVGEESNKDDKEDEGEEDEVG